MEEAGTEGSVGDEQERAKNKKQQPTSAAAEEQGLEGGEAAPVRPRRRRGRGDDD